MYADLLIKRIQGFNSKVFLVNTGWTGGPHGVGKRFDIPTTRRIVNAIQNGELDNVETNSLPGLNLSIPTSIEGVDPNLLNPKLTWSNPEAYDQAANELIEKFVKNFSKFDVRDAIVKAGPQL